MAITSSRQTSIFGLQNWKAIYQTYADADFTSYDYETLRASMIDQIKRKYPETFSDYIESSEFVAILDVISFMGQSLAFRSDLNARESFLDTAERRDSVIKLANLVSYNAKRNTAAQGLLKVTSLSTTENVFDINGNLLSNRAILWNDPANSSWQEQFNTILNASLVNSQRIGRPGNSQNILNVKTDEYSINIQDGVLPVIPFKATVDSTAMNFELVSATSLNQTYLYEIPPAPTSQFNILYRNDKLGYGSINTGFFLYFKQGTLQSLDINFPEKIQNNTQPINTTGINNEDTWLYKLDDLGRITQRWTQVESVYTGTFDTQGQSVKPIFSVASRSNDEVTYLFSDGMFGEIPYGMFRAYFRSSNALQYSISPSEMSGITANINYISRVGTLETLTLTFSLQTPCNTAQARESLADIKRRAPARYYTQNRMVNGEDYNNFPFTLYNSIIKSKALNRSSIGISRNLELIDPTGKYSSTNVFATDGALYYNGESVNTSFSTTSTVYAAEFLSSTLPVLLSGTSSVQYYQQNSTRYDGSISVLGDFYWHQSTVIGSQSTGYFFTVHDNGSTKTEIPVPVGAFSTYTTRYISKGALLKFVAPPGKLFDKSNRLTTDNNGVTHIWATVAGVVGDGYNYGNGNLSSGSGPITLDVFVPGSTLDSNNNITQIGAGLQTTEAIIPEFDNTPSSSVVNDALNLIKRNQNFWLKFDNSLISTQERWSVTTSLPADPTTALVEFVSNISNQTYDVSIKSVVYEFASVADVRFLFDGAARVYDPRSGQVLSDTIKIFNGGDGTQLGVTGQTVESDGFVNDFAVIVSSLNSNSGSKVNPDFFKEIAGSTSATNASNSVFFAVTMNSNGTSQSRLLPPGSVVYSSTVAKTDEIKYQYASGQVYYCPNALTMTATRANYTVTVNTNNDHYLQSGDSVTITGFDDAAFNGSYVVEIVSTSKSFTYTLKTNIAASTATGGQLNDRFYKSSTVTGVTPAIFTLTDVTSSYSIAAGTGDLSFQYKRNSGNTTRIDPATTNIIDLYLVTQSYYTSYMNWLADTTDTVMKPTVPTINELQQSYGTLDEYKMISDTVVVNSVTFKPLFGKKAESNLQGTIKVIKNPNTTASDSQIRSGVLSALNTYFSIDNWSFGEIFYFSELTAYLHAQLGSLISSVILVPTNPASKFGTLYEVRSQPNEIFCNGASASDIVVVSSLTAANMNR